MVAIGAGVSLRGIPHDEWHYPMNLKAGIVAADCGKAVSLDATAANTVQLAGDTEEIFGQLVSVEDRVVEGVLVGTVAVKGPMLFTYDTADAVAVGDPVIGGALGDGQVKKWVTAVDPQNRSQVVEKNATDETVVVILF